MRILMLGEAISPHLQRWADELEKLGWDVAVASADFRDDFKGHKLEARSERGPLRYIQLVDQIKRLADEFQPQAINAHFLPTYGLAAAMANLHPLILTLWGSDILVSGQRGFLRRRRTRFVLERSDLVVGDAEHLLREAEKLGRVKRRLMVPFGVKQVWVESGEARTIAETDRVKILSCRQLEPLYDVATLVKAAAILKQRDAGFHVTIVGEGSQANDLAALSQKLDVTDKITFTGRLSQEKLFSAYRNSDVYVSTAHSDSTSVSLLEAMSQKLYPVVTDIPGNREWLENERHFFESGNHEQLGERLQEALSIEARQQAWREYWTVLKQKGIREQQTKIADLTFRKLIDEFAHR